MSSSSGERRRSNRHHSRRLDGGRELTRLAHDGGIHRRCDRCCLNRVIHDLCQRGRTAGKANAVVVRRRDGVRARGHRLGLELCRASAQRHNLQNRRAIIEGHGPCGRAAELGRHARCPRHRLPKARRIQRSDQRGRGCGFADHLKYGLRGAAAVAGVPVVHGLDRVCTHVERRSCEASRTATQPSRSQNACALHPQTTRRFSSQAFVSARSHERGLVYKLSWQTHGAIRA